MQRDLKAKLEEIYERYHTLDSIKNDPLSFPRRYTEARDQEIVALVSALLAYGNVKAILNSVERILKLFHDFAGSPAKFLENWPEKDFRNKAVPQLKKFKHRFTTGTHVAALFDCMTESFRSYGGVGLHLKKYLSEADESVEKALIQMLSDWKKIPGTKDNFLITSPEDGSACKRWMMLLRWMTRQDGVDLGLWTFIQPSQLVFPLDVHTTRIARELGLLRRKTNSWKGALEVTKSLKKFDALDPVRFDFSLCHMGMAKANDNLKKTV